jgi:hypothetical protein
MSERCQPFAEMLVAAQLGLLNETDRSRLAAHLQDCAACRQLENDLADDDRRLHHLAGQARETLPDLALRIENQLIEPEKHEESSPAETPVWHRPWFRWALAASVALVAFLGLNLTGQNPAGGVVWAEVITRVQDTTSFICRKIEKRTGDPVQEIVEYHSAELGLRQDIYVKGKLQAEQYIVPADQTLYALIHRDRSYLKQSLSEEQMLALREKGNARSIVASFKEYEYRKLGRRSIDGRLAEGIEVRDPQEWQPLFEEGVWKLWVDLETGWPVLIELEGKASGGKVRKTYTLKDFQWNVRLTEKDFAFTIPENYTLIADLQANLADEEHALAGLRAYAKLLGGRYPSKLSLSTAIAEAEDELDRRHGGYTEAAGKDLESLFLIRDTCLFFAKLEEEGRSPSYHGDRVGRADFDEVLLRWRLDSGDWRVVYGDLRVTDQPAESADSP